MEQWGQQTDSSISITSSPFFTSSSFSSFSGCSSSGSIFCVDCVSRSCHSLLSPESFPFLIVLLLFSRYHFFFCMTPSGRPPTLIYSHSRRDYRKRYPLSRGASTKRNSQSSTYTLIYSHSHRDYRKRYPDMPLPKAIIRHPILLPDDSDINLSKFCTTPNRRQHEILLLT